MKTSDSLQDFAYEEIKKRIQKCDSHLSFFSFFLCFFIFAWVQTEAPRVPHQIFCP